MTTFAIFAVQHCCERKQHLFMPLKPKQAAPVGQHPCTNALVLGFKTLPTAWLLGSSWGSLDTVQGIKKFCLKWAATAISNSSWLLSFWLCLLYPWNTPKTRVLTGIVICKRALSPCTSKLVEQKLLSTSVLWACQERQGDVQGCDQTFIPRPGPPHLHCRSAAFPRCIYGSSLSLCCLSYLLPLLKTWVVSSWVEAKEIDVVLRITTKLVLPGKTKTEIGSGDSCPEAEKAKGKILGGIMK